MSLTLDDVKNVRFPIAKRVGDGYRAAEVDAFLDKVEAALSSAIDENNQLKAQLAQVQQGTSGAVPDDARVQQLNQRVEQLQRENQDLRSQASKAAQASQSAPAVAGADPAELERLRSENAGLREQADQLNRQLAEHRQSAAQAAQNPQTQHLVVTSSQEASPAVTRLVELATQQAESVVSEANAEAQRTVADANAQASRVTNDAQIEAEAQRREAQRHADHLTAEAQRNADRVNSDAAARRQELFSSLEAERDRLVGSVEQLRTYEQSYRSNLTQHLQQAIDTVNGGSVQPEEVPVLLAQRSGSASGSAGDTPRLNALAAEAH